MKTAVAQEAQAYGRVRRGFYVASKRTVDVVVATLLLALSLPLWPVLIIAIRLDSKGHALFRQERVGLHGRHFQILKFRTMEAGADDTVHREHHEALANGSRSDQPIRLDDDPRITRVGKVIRRWSLDELPNLWNVLKGDMTLVGPRPLVPYEADHLRGEARRRFDVKPGITGLAQVNGRLDISMDGRTDYDVQYVDTRSFWLDLKIVLMTAPALIRNRGG